MSGKLARSYSKFKVALKLKSFQQYFIKIDKLLKLNLGQKYGILWFLDTHYTENLIETAEGHLCNVRYFPSPKIDDRLIIFYPSKRELEFRSIQGLADGVFIPKFNWRNISRYEHFVEMYCFMFFRFTLQDFIRCLLYDYRQTVYYVRRIIDEE